jgi:hypothetical protein
MHTAFWLGDLRERGNLEDLGVDGTVILKWIFRKSDRDMDWIDLPQGKKRWLALLHAITNRPAP